jgi:proteasome lid subunit RPN8/RPN11
MEEQHNTRVTLSVDAQKTLMTDIYQRQHIEACGVLLGTIDEQENWHVERVIPLPNVFDSPVYFEFAPEDLLAVDLDYPGQIIGAYHSHPTGLAVASRTDRKNMKRVNQDQQIPWVWLIVSGPFDSASNGHDTPIIAYHHYTQGGLKQIPVQFEEVHDAITHNMSHHSDG